MAKVTVPDDTYKSDINEQIIFTRVPENRIAITCMHLDDKENAAKLEDENGIFLVVKRNGDLILEDEHIGNSDRLVKLVESFVVKEKTSD